MQLLIPVWVGNGYRICGSVGFRGCIGYMKTLVTLHLLNLYGWETAWVFQFLRVFAAVLALRLVSEYWRYFSGYIHIRYLLALFP